MLAYVWSAGDTVAEDIKPLTPRQAIGPRTFITVVFSFGLLVFIAVVRTFRSWGDNEDPRRELLTRSEASRSKVTATETAEGKKSADIANMA